MLHNIKGAPHTPQGQNSLYMFKVMRGHAGLVSIYKTKFLRVKLKIIFFRSVFCSGCSKEPSH